MIFSSKIISVVGIPRNISPINVFDENLNREFSPENACEISVNTVSWNPNLWRSKDFIQSDSDALEKKNVFF